MTKINSLDCSKIDQAVMAIKRGKLIVYPTDTQYALGCSINNLNAIKKIYHIKKRPATLPLPIAISSIKELDQFTYISPMIIKIAKEFLPGPLTIILKSKSSIPSLVRAQRGTVGIRIPNNYIALALLRKIGPLVITSANIHGQEPSQTLHDIKKQFGEQIALYLSGGILKSNPSTIVDLSVYPPELKRPGSITIKEILNVIKE